jgi:hypothetical protein
VIVGGIAGAVCTISAFLAGPGPIIRSQTSRAVASTRGRTTARARSYVLATDLPGTADLRSPYDEEGVNVEYAIGEAGIVDRSVGAAAPAPLTFVPSQLPPFATPPGSGTLAVSYDDMRRGAWGKPPVFDMIGAGSDRVIAKMAETDQIFIGVTGDPYLHPVGGRRVMLPQSYFKLDPEIGTPSEKIADLVAHVTIPGDDERHPATERFPFFRAAFSLGAVTVSLPIPSVVTAGLRISQVPFSFRFFKGAGDLGLIQMDTWFPPHVWQKVDLRPERDTTDPPSRFPTYEHVVFATNNDMQPEKPRRSVAYTRVLDLGVGLSHLHEQHDNRFGGEIDCLLGKRRSFLGFTIPTDEEAYEFANGPIRDFGGWVDGTCIYYILVQLKEVDEKDPSTFRDAFAVIWSDEQAAFTERWRVLALDDKSFQSPFKPIVGVVTDQPNDFYPNSPFDASRFWDPFGPGHVLPDSRMTVTRQILVINGRDPDTGTDELYSIHFSWPTMDRTWRWRPLPEGAKSDGLHIREDTTILLSGSQELDGEAIAGRFFQRYLPADGQEIPSLADRMNDAVGTKPSQGYVHPWGFVREEIATRMDREFSHFGVYEPVRSRIQLYRVTLVERGELTDEEIEMAVWEDIGHAFTIVRDQLSWAGVGALLSGTGNVSGLVVHRTHPSTYNDPMSFRIANRPGLGFVMTHFDKRDDKLIAIDGVGTPALSMVVLSDRDNPRRSITVSVNSHHRNNVRALHGTTVDRETDAVSPPQVRRATIAVTPSMGQIAIVHITLEAARGPAAMNDYATYEEWLGMNIWRVKLGAWIEAKRGAPAVPTILFDVVRASAFTAAPNDPTRLSATWTPTPQDQRNGLLIHLLSDRGRTRWGTSLWMVGATGLACCPDELAFGDVAR